MQIGKHLFTVKLRHHKLIPDTIGIQSVCGLKHHVLFLDFDGTRLDTVKRRLLFVQKKYDTGNFYIIRSSPFHYHAISIRKFSFGEVCDIQHDLYMDKYLTFSVKRGYWVLRVSEKGDKEKPILIDRVNAKSKREGSYAHWKWLRLNFGIGHEENTKGFPQVLFDVYTTEEKL